MSNLHEYLSREGLTQRAFASLVGVDQSIVSRLKKGEMTPSLPLAARIERATGGAVPMESWVENSFDKAG